MKSINTKYEDQWKYTSKIIKNKAFTLVELIIVITILAILATIAFVSFKNYAWSARDGNKLTTLSSIEKWLSLYQIKIWNYPTPDNIYGSGSYSWALLSQVWFVGSWVVQSINMNKIPKDPIVNFEYTYWLSNNKKYYQLGTVLENNETAFIQQTYANNYTSKVVWNYKWLYRFSTGWLNYIINLPSLLFTQSWAQDFGNISNDPKFVINNGWNLVKPYDEWNQEEVNTVLEKLTQTWGINLKTQEVPTDWNSGSGTLAQELWYSEDQIWHEIYGEKYYTDKNNLQPPTPAPIVYASCDLNGTTIPHGTSITRYETTSVTFWNTCTSEQRSCDNGTLSWSFTNESCSVAGATGTFTLSNTSVAFWTDVNISNTCSTAPTSYTSSNTSVAIVSWTTITTLTTGTTTITPVWWACWDNEGKTLTVTTPICTSFTYSSWWACQSNNAQTRTILTQTPSGCSGGSPDVLEQSCTYVPPVVAWRDISWTSCDNDDYVFTQWWVTYKWAWCNSVLWTGIEWSASSPYCYNYAGTKVTCWTTAQMASTAKEIAWNDTTSTVNNIWWKLYTYAQASAPNENASTTTWWACPSGWHLPTDAEWTALETKLKGSVCRTADWWQCEWLWWLWNASKNSSNNIIQALKIPLAGFRSSDGVTFYNRGNNARLWSSDQSTRYFDSGYGTVLRGTTDAADGFSVRCVKD